MTTVVSLSEAARARADELIRSGRYKTFCEVVEAAVGDDHESWMDEPMDLEDLSADDRAAIEEGLADIEAGRVHTLNEVITKLRADIDALRK